jgi:hypothetical protein
MNAANAPKFTAEASLYKSNVHYRVAGSPNDLLSSREVLPQLPVGFCMAECDFTISDPFLSDVCKLGCLGGSGGGGVFEPRDFEPRCRPRCSRCLPDLESETGRSRTCVRADCEVATIPC